MHLAAAGVWGGMGLLTFAPVCPASACYFSGAACFGARGIGGMRERICGREAGAVCCGMQGAMGTGFAGRGMHTARGQKSWNGMERYGKQF